MTLTNTFVRNYPYGALRVAHPRLRRRDLAGPAEVEQGLRARTTRSARPGSRSSFDKELRGRPGLEPATGRLARAAGQPDRACGRRSLPATRSGSRSTRSSSRRPQQAVVDGINLAAGGPPVVREGGRDRRPRPAGRRDPARSPRTRPSTRRHSRAARRAPSRSLTNADVAKADDHPALDRAIAGAYPPGSTFKPVTALAAMQEHILSPYNVPALHGLRTRSRARSSRTGTRS